MKLTTIIRQPIHNSFNRIVGWHFAQIFYNELSDELDTQLDVEFYNKMYLQIVERFSNNADQKLRDVLHD